MKWKLKNPTDVLHLKGGEILHGGNITDKRVDELIEGNPNFAVHFDKVEEAKKKEDEKK